MIIEADPVKVVRLFNGPDAPPKKEKPRRSGFFVNSVSGRRMPLDAKKVPVIHTTDMPIEMCRLTEGGA